MNCPPTFTPRHTNKNRPAAHVSTRWRTGPTEKGYIVKDEFEMSRLPREWGGPFIWTRNHRGNLELQSVAKIIDTASDVVESIREHLRTKAGAA